MTAIKAPATMPIIMAVFSAASELIRSRMRLFLSEGIRDALAKLKKNEHRNLSKLQVSPYLQVLDSSPFPLVLDVWSCSTKCPGCW